MVLAGPWLHSIESLLNERPAVSFLSRLFGNRTDSVAAVRPLWHRVVAIAREKAWYAEHGVADTVAGRFDAITLVLALVLLRMEQDQALVEPSVRLTELFVEDMDGQLRESGIGDLVVGKHIGRLMGTLGGRLGALREALPQADAALAEVLSRNVTLLDGTDPAELVPPVRALAATLAATSSEDLMAARIAR
jgi:cytochrome b pre-mRNA-processing protein 3